MITSDNLRFVRLWWERGHDDVPLERFDSHADTRLRAAPWTRYVMGTHRAGAWLDPAEYLCRWSMNALEVKIRAERQYGSTHER